MAEAESHLRAWTVLLLVAIVFSEVEGIFPSQNIERLLFTKTVKNSVVTSSPTDFNYTTRYLQLPVDHFGFTNKDRFQLRYLVADQFWDRDNGPVFFYTGNEGDIVLFLENTGFMWDLAPDFNALIIFAEHRYYGESMPYGNDSYKDPKHLGYLSSEQALGDFASLISYLKWSDRHLEKAPFIAFGGSYGGMLAAWMRMKYPHFIQGALAASAPVWYFGDLTPCDAFYRITTEDFTRESPYCSSNIKKSWDTISKLGKSSAGRVTLTNIFHLCQPLNNETDVEVLKGWLAGTYGNMAMVDYPYAANFLAPLPAWPIKVACQYLKQESLSDTDLLKGVSLAVGVYYNYTGKAKCFNTAADATSSLGDQGWSFQACTEMVMPMCTTGKNDMFEPSPWNITAFSDGCKKQWGVTPRPNAALVEYGGKHIKSASNIIFSNGKLDPWSGAGVLASLSDSLVAIIIEEAAHHLDLRKSNPKDPQSLITARKQEKDIITSWINAHWLEKTGVVLAEHPALDLDGPIAAVSQKYLAGIVVVVLLVFLSVLALTTIRRKTSYLILSQPSTTSTWFGSESQALLHEDKKSVPQYA